MNYIKSIYYSAIVLLLICSSSCGPKECPEQSQKTNAVYLFVDYTDPLNFEMLQKNWEKDLKKINAMFPLESCIGGELVIVPITDVGSNEIKQIHYKPLPADLNEFNPPIDYTIFKRKIKTALKDAVDVEAKELNSTYLYEPMCHNLNKLSGEKTEGRKIAIFYSDMLEHSDVGSMYQYKKNLNALKDKWTESFGCTLPNLHDTEIYVINHRNQSTDDFIRKANLFWQDVFTEKGAMVVDIASNLDLRL